MTFLSNALDASGTPVLIPFRTGRRWTRRSRPRSRTVWDPSFPFPAKYPLEYAVTRLGNVTEVTVTTQLLEAVTYHWYLDGVYMGATTGPTFSFFVEDDEQAVIEVIDDPGNDFDPILQAPAHYPARYTLWWIRSLDSDVDHYRVEQNKDAGGWETLELVPHDDDRWDYWVLTGRLTDLSTYQWRVYPVDAAGNDGTVLTLQGGKCVRTPDAVNFTATFDDGTTKITFFAAA